MNSSLTLPSPPFVHLAGSGHFLPGKAIPADEVDLYLGDLQEAPEKIRQWLKRIRKILKELVEVEYYHFAMDPVTRKFTEDNVTMSVKAAREAMKDAGVTPSDIEFIVYASAHQDQMPTASVRIQEQLGIAECAEIQVPP